MVISSPVHRGSALISSRGVKSNQKDNKHGICSNDNGSPYTLSGKCAVGTTSSLSPPPSFASSPRRTTRITDMNVTSRKHTIWTNLSVMALVMLIWTVTFISRMLHEAAISCNANTMPDDVAILPAMTTTARSATTLSQLQIDFPFEKPEITTSKSKMQPTIVFYHIYIPATNEGKQNSARIIQEQLQQLYESSSILKQQQRKYTVYYNTVGDLSSSELNHSHIQQWCQNYTSAITCHPMEHYDQGMEDETLQRIHDFCTLYDSLDVIYLHTKGSYTLKPVNEAWRYQMTQAVTSTQCHDSIQQNVHKQGNSTTANLQCNLCGLYFTAERGMFMAGNMWHSSCSYIKQLLPPKDFEIQMQQVTSDALMERLRYKLLMRMQELRAGVFGIDRYSSEFWIASHPTIQPCDFSYAVPIKDLTDPNLTDHFLNWLRKMGKNYKQVLQSDWFVPNAPQTTLPLPSKLIKYENIRLREYFLLAGNLFRWYYLYEQAPPFHSWVYNWFPDGHKWKIAIQKYGKDCVNIVTTAALQDEMSSGTNQYTAHFATKKTNNNNNDTSSSSA